MVTEGKYRCFLTIMDDYSKAAWTYLLNCKSHAFPVLKIFYKYVNNKFDADIKIVRSNNALEFESGPIETFFF